MLDKLRIAIVLVVIGAISGFTIYSVNLLTKDTIAENIIEKERGFYKELFYLDDDVEITYEANDLDSENVTQEIVLYDSLGEVIGYIYKGVDQNNYGEVTVLIGISIDGEISNVVISSTTNTPTFVKVIKNDYLSPFASQNVDQITVDSSTGATYTYTSVTKIVQNAADYFLENRGELHD
jgi:electron transport complex protein RnfG